MSWKGSDLFSFTIKSTSHLWAIQDHIADIRETPIHINQLLLSNLITHLQLQRRPLLPATLLQLKFDKQEEDLSN